MNVPSAEIIGRITVTKPDGITTDIDMRADSVGFKVSKLKSTVAILYRDMDVCLK